VNAQDRLINGVESRVEIMVGGMNHILEIFLIPVMGFYFLKDREYFQNIIIMMIPYSWRRNVLHSFMEIHKILHHFIRGQLLVSALIGILYIIGFWVTGLPYALVLGIIAGMFEIIPYFGPWLGAIPAIIIALAHESTRIFWTVGVILIIQQLENSIITPKIMGGQVDLHPVYILISLWAGGLFFGIIGMLFAVPVVLILRVILKNIYMSIVTSKT
jgi:predicted PurR-regulated permease PerM